MPDFAAPALTREEPILKADDDALGYDVYAQRLANLILKAETPFTLAIEGSWGGGKSSMMKLIKAHVQAKAIPVEVSVWELATQDAVWYAFVQAMFNQVNAQVKRDGRLKYIDWAKARGWLLENIWRILLVIIPPAAAGLAQLNGGWVTLGLVTSAVALWQTIIGPALKAGAAAVKPFDLNTMLKSPSYQEQISLLTELRAKFAELVAFALENTGKQQVVVFIDDLDRCEAAQIPAVIEALKLFVTVEKCVYVVGVDRDIVEKALMAKRGLSAEDAQAYLEKVVQLWFPMPEFDVEKARSYVTKQLQGLDLPDAVTAAAPELFVELFRTPRRFKQAVNRYKALLAVRSPDMRAEFGHKPSEDIPKEERQKRGELAILQMFLIEQAIPQLYAFLKTYPGYTYALWEHVHTCYRKDRDWYTFANRDEKGQLRPGFRSLSIWRGYLKRLDDDDDEDQYATPFETGRLTRKDVAAVTVIVSKSAIDKGYYYIIFPREVHEWVDAVNLTLPDSALRSRLDMVRQISTALSASDAGETVRRNQIQAIIGDETKFDTWARDWRGYDPIRAFNTTWLLHTYDWFRLAGLFQSLMHPNDLRGADLREVRLEEAFLIKTQLAWAELSEAQLERSYLLHARLEGAALSKAHLEGADLRHAHLEGADLREAHLEGANLSDTHLERAVLSKAHLEDATLRNAHLEYGDLSLLHLERADLLYAHLERANMSFAYLVGTDMRKVYLIGATLCDAYLNRADLREAALRDAQLDNAEFDEKTVLPDAKVKRDDSGNPVKDADGHDVYDKYWTPDTDMSRYTNPDHPDFWEPEWYKEEREAAAQQDTEE